MTHPSVCFVPSAGLTRQAREACAAGAARWLDDPGSVEVQHLAAGPWMVESWPHVDALRRRLAAVGSTHQVEARWYPPAPDGLMGWDLFAGALGGHLQDIAARAALMHAEDWSSDLAKVRALFVADVLGALLPADRPALSEAVDLELLHHRAMSGRRSLAELIAHNGSNVDVLGLLERLIDERVGPETALLLRAAAPGEIGLLALATLLGTRLPLSEVPLLSPPLVLSRSGRQELAGLVTAWWVFRKSESGTELPQRTNTQAATIHQAFMRWQDVEWDGAKRSFWDQVQTATGYAIPVETQPFGAQPPAAVLSLRIHEIELVPAHGVDDPETSALTVDELVRAVYGGNRTSFRRSEDSSAASLAAVSHDSRLARLAHAVIVQATEQRARRIVADSFEGLEVVGSINRQVQEWLVKLESTDDNQRPLHESLVDRLIQDKAWRHDVLDLDDWKTDEGDVREALRNWLRQHEMPVPAPPRCAAMGLKMAHDRHPVAFADIRAADHAITEMGTQLEELVDECAAFYLSVVPKLWDSFRVTAPAKKFFSKAHCTNAEPAASLEEWRSFVWNRRTKWDSPWGLFVAIWKHLAAMPESAALGWPVPEPGDIFKVLQDSRNTAVHPPRERPKTPEEALARWSEYLNLVNLILTRGEFRSMFPVAVRVFGVVRTELFTKALAINAFGLPEPFVTRHPVEIGATYLRLARNNPIAIDPLLKKRATDDRAQ